MVLTPYISVDEIKFGMDQSQVCSVLGKPYEQRKNYLGECENHYNSDRSLHVVFQKQPELVTEIVVAHPQQLFILEDHRSANDNSFGIDEVRKHDSELYELDNLIISLRLGIMIGGILLADEELQRRFVVAFSRDRLPKDLYRRMKSI